MNCCDTNKILIKSYRGKQRPRGLRGPTGLTEIEGEIGPTGPTGNSSDGSNLIVYN